MNTYDNILDLVGRTPLVRLRTGIPEGCPPAYVKLEFYNPTASVKDRMTSYVLQKAVKDGRLKAGDTVIDNTSGNTGSALAMAACVLGLKTIVTAPVKTSKEKLDLIRSFGAEVIVTPETEHDDPEGYYEVARRLAKEHGYFDLDQYDNQENVEAHYNITGPEVWNDTDGRITHFVCGIGTGGTFSGTSRYLKEQNPKVQCIAVDPEGSLFRDLIEGSHEIEPRSYKIEGIGSDVMTKAMHAQYVDRLIRSATVRHFGERD